MSFQSLISGSECAVPSNPLSQVLKHTEGDRSLQQDRVAGPSSIRLHQLPGTSAANASEHDLALARQFFENGHGPAFVGRPMNQHMPAPQGPDLNGAWSMEQHQHIRAQQENYAKAAWANEFDGSSQMSTPGPMSPEIASGMQPEYQQRPSMSPMSSMNMGMGMYGAQSPFSMYQTGMMPNMYQAGMQGNYGAPLVQGKGKGKSREADFENAFARITESFAQKEEERSRIVEVDDSLNEIEAALQDTHLKDATEDGLESNPEFKRVWDHLQNSDLPPPQEDLSKWEAEFNQLMSSQRDELDFDYGGDMQQAWEGGLGNLSGAGAAFQEKMLQFDADGLPLLDPYVFEPENKYLGPTTSPRSYLNDAKALLEQNGSLSEAALLLEAAIQKGEMGEGGYESWIMLGETRNMDEREEAGMRALTQGVKIAEAAGTSGAGMISLAISFTNESYDRASHTMLLRWLRARYPSQPVPEETIQALKTNSSWDTHERITSLFLDLARTQHSQGIMDADVQIALGVLFYTNSEYDRARDCFEAALSVRPKDYLLWNRLGSSLSNGSKPEEALGPYREALLLRPTYTRAIYNVGVACLNIGAHKEAAEHFLSALTLQDDSAGESSGPLWFTLRRAFISMDRNDLAELAKPETKNNLEVFRREGFDF